MNLMLIVAGFGLGMAVLLVLASHYYGRAFMAKRTAAFMGRVAEMGPGGGGLLDIRMETLAKTERMRVFLRDMPFVPQLALMIEQSGVRITVARFFVETSVCVVAVFTAFLFMQFRAPVAALMGLLSIGLGPARLIIARQRRALAFEAQLPQSVELIALYLRAGRSLSQAFVAATEEMGPPAGEEFKVAAEEYRLGRPLDHSLKRLADRFPDSIGFRLFAIAAAVLTQTGGNLVEVLDRIKKTLEAGITYGLRLQAMTSEARMSAKVLATTPGIFMFLVALRTEDYFDLFLHNRFGRILLVVFLTLWLSGIFWVRSLIKSKMA